MPTTMNDQAYMAEALRDAVKGLYSVRINPRVGCVIVKNEQIIARGFHAYAGHTHAEINALANAKENAAGATAYITLEPCSHQGKTAACVESLVQAKLSQVVVANIDPNPLVNGKGLAYLNEHGIQTKHGVLENEAGELNKGFFTRITQTRPYVTLKSASSLDGRTALQSGESKWISSKASRKDVQFLRARSCAILTGIDTILADDPAFTVRLTKQDLKIENDSKSEFEQPLRVIVDTHLRITKDANIFKQPGKNLIYTCVQEQTKIAKFSQTNTKIVSCNSVDEKVDLHAVMKDLAAREINEVLVEAGATLTGSLLTHKLVDEMMLYIAPCYLGTSSRGLAELKYISSMQDRLNLNIIQTNLIGSDIKITAKPLY